MKHSNTQHVTLDLNFTELKAVKFKQYNKGSQKIILTITENGQPLPLDSASMKCYFKMITPADTHKFNDENVSINEDGTVTVNIKESYCLAAGTARAELNIVNTVDETQICTMNFNLIIEGSVYDNHIIEDCDDFSALTKVLTENEHRAENLILLDKDLREADDVRMANENIRIANEETRISNENNRISSETDRENAEQKREDDFSTAITNAGTATQNANTAAADADQAAQNASFAAGRADTATQNANTTIEEMRALMANDNILHVDQLGASGGIATLDEEGFLSASQIPDRTIEYYYGTLDKETQTFTTVDGEVLIGKINKCYVDTHTNIPYTWSGTEFIATGSNLALGTTSATAFPGDRGVSLEQRVTGIEEYHNDIPASDIKFNNSNTNLSGANVQAAIEDLTDVATPLRNGLLSAEDKKRIDSYANITEIPITLSASSWTGTEAPYTQTVAVSELQGHNNCSVEIHPDTSSEQENALLESEINITAYSETSGLSFSATSKPSVDIPILLCAGASMNVVNVPNYIGETPVTGIKGSAEASFRQGQVNLTPEHLGALPADGDSQNNTVTFPTAETQNSWTDVADLASGEKHNALFHKLSTMMKNVRYLYGLLGTANITSIGNGTVTGALSKLNTDLLERVYPVGAIYMSVNSANPGTLFGGTWEAWGIGRVPVGVNTGEGNFNAVEKAGGASSVSYTPVGTVGYHTLTTAEIPSHAHSVGAHSHGLNNHTHTIGAHSHGLNNHTHNFSASTNSITLSGNLWNFAVQSDTSGISTSGIISKNNVNGGAVGYATVRKTGSSTTYTDTVNINASHGHSLSGTTNAAAGSTANSAVFYSGAASGSTANSTAFNSGPNGSGNSHNHGFTGTAGSISTIQPYITCYMWKRIA